MARHETTCKLCGCTLAADYTVKDNTLELSLVEVSDDDCVCEFLSQEDEEAVYKQLTEEIQAALK